MPFIKLLKFLHYIFLIFYIRDSFSFSYTGKIPIYIEDNHAGSFYWIWNNLDLKRDYSLILFDEHSDSTALYRSDLLRDMRYAMPQIRTDKSHDLSTRNIIQSFNWIEPLMPFPISHVLWVNDFLLSKKEKKKHYETIKDNLNMFTDIFPRKVGKLDHLFKIEKLELLQSVLKKNYEDDLIVSIDFDFFSKLKTDKEINDKMDEVWNTILKLNRVKAITVAISRPYLKSKKQADTILKLFLDHAFKIQNVFINFEPFLYRQNDSSELAKKLMSKKKEIPKYSINNADSNLKRILFNNKQKIFVYHQTKKWNEFILSLSKEFSKEYNIYLKKISGTFDYSFQTHHFVKNSKFTIEIFPRPVNHNISWVLLKTNSNVYNITSLREGFAFNASPFIETIKIKLPFLKGRYLLNESDLKDLFDFKTGLGQITLKAIITDKNNQHFETKEIHLSKSIDNSFCGHLTEVFNLPYIFGEYLLSQENHFSPKIGNDCSSLIGYGMRRMKRVIQSLNPFQLHHVLVHYSDVDNIKNGILMSGNKKIIVNRNIIKNGLLIYLKSHIAALYHVNSSKGIVSINDLVIHQLEGKAEIIKIKELPHYTKGFELLLARPIKKNLTQKKWHERM